jgi:hypothetical protein
MERFQELDEDALKCHKYLYKLLLIIFTSALILLLINVLFKKFVKSV